MPYAPQRRHVVGLITQTAQALNVIQLLLQPNLLVFFARTLAQLQINAAGYVHPNRSLLSLSAMLVLMNATAVLLHLLDHLGGPGKGLVLDFVGQAHTASLSRILLLDLLIFVLQIHSLSISYLSNKATTTFPAVPSLPYADVLLPVIEAEDEVSPHDFDVESGLRRRKGKRSTADADDEVWLDDDVDEEGGQNVQPSERDRLLSQSNPSRKIAREPPRILSLPISHLLNLITHMPSPTPPARLFSGATPAVSPSGTPRREAANPLANASTHRETLLSHNDQTGEDDDSEEGEEEEEQERESERRSIVRNADASETRRVPGDYWVGSRGNGG